MAMLIAAPLGATAVNIATVLSLCCTPLPDFSTHGEVSLTPHRMLYKTGAWGWSTAGPSAPGLIQHMALDLMEVQSCALAAGPVQVWPGQTQPRGSGSGT